MQNKQKTSKYNPFEWPFFGTIGLASGIIYCIFTAISFLFFPTSFNWSNSYLSSLGDFYDNPSGAIFYDVGMILTGVTATIFYIGFYKWSTKYQKSKTLFISLLFGCINGFSIMMAGVFSETQESYSLHIFWSLIIFFSFFPFVILVNISFLTNTNIKKTIAFFGFGVALIDAIFFSSVILNGTGGTDPFMEWLSVFSYIGWACLLAVNTLRTPDFK
ncbi:MAG: hypothetical protein ACW964_04210 [Candidatus Hodarchaeales archaeon]|jgi:hypothetical protein